MAATRRRIVVVGNAKGGVGKTTVCVNLAAMAAAAIDDVLVVDSDPGQQSARKWSARRRETMGAQHKLTTVALSGDDISDELESLSARYSTVFVDTGAMDSHELRAAALLADVWVVPIVPEAYDLWSMPEVEQLYKRVRKLNRKLRVVIAINRVSFQTAAANSATTPGIIAELVPSLAGVPIVSLVSRAVYGRAGMDGMGVAECARPDAKAVGEFSTLYEEVMR